MKRKVRTNSREVLNIPDPRGAEDDFFTQVVRDVVNRALSILEEREALVLRLYFGLDPYTQPMSLREIAEQISRTPKTVGQIKFRALWKISRHPDAEGLLYDFWEDLGRSPGQMELIPEVDLSQSEDTRAGIEEWRERVAELRNPHTGEDR